MLINIEIAGITPLMLDRFTEDMLKTGPKSSNNGQQEKPEDQCKRKLYLDDKDIAVFPADNLLACIVDAGRFIKVGRRQLSTRDTTTVTAMLSIIENFVPIKSEKGWRVDARGIVNQATKGRHIAYRPIFDQWGFSFTIDLDTTECATDTARELVDRSGRHIGIGVMRPSRKGRYGQFKVIHWTERK